MNDKPKEPLTDSKRRDIMFNHIVLNGGIVKSQQRDEKDLTINEKKDILQAGFEANKENFLYKFGKFLNTEDLKNFDTVEQESNCYYYLDKLKQNLNFAKTEVKSRNRRYNYLWRILKKSNYFSDEETKIRCPFLYQQYIEQYKSNNERLAEKENDLSQNTLSQFLLGRIDSKVYQARCKIEEQAAEIEEDEDEDDTDEQIEEDPDFKKCIIQ